MALGDHAPPMGKYLERGCQAADDDPCPAGRRTTATALPAPSPRSSTTTRNENGTINHYGGPPPPPSNAANYLTDVLGQRAAAFVNRAAQADQPFVMEVASFAPHKPYIPAPRNANDFQGLREPRDPSFDTANTNAPKWLGSRAPLSAAEVALIDRDFRMRAQSVEAVDRLLGNLEATLRARGLASNTYIVFSSDNGYHMGQHRLLPGKQTAFDTDIKVPLIVVGPGVPHNRRITAFAENVDLHPTFLRTRRRTADRGRRWT